MAEQLRAISRLSVLAVLFRLQLIQTWRPGKTVREKVQSAFLALMLGLLGLMWTFFSFMLAKRAAEAPHIPPLFLLIVMGMFFYGTLFVMLLSAGNAGVSFDVGKLFHLPLRPGELILSQFFGGLLLNPQVLLFPAALFAGLTAGSFWFSRPALGLSCAAAFVLWSVQFCAATLMAEYVLTRIQRSLKMAQMVIFVGMLAFLVSLLLFSYISEKQGLSWEGVLEAVTEQWDYWHRILVLLPGLSAVGWIGMGRYGWVVLAAALAETALFCAAAHLALRGLMTSARSESLSRSKKAPGASANSRPIPLASPAWWPFFRKDFRLSAKDQASAILFVGVLLNLFLPLMAADPEAARFYGLIMHWLSPLVCVVLTGMLAVNALGLEGPGLMLTLSSSSPRWRFILGKNLAGLIFGIVPVAIPATFLGFEGEGTPQIAGLFFFAAGIGMVQTGIANFISLLVPYPAAQPGKSLFPPVSQSRMLFVSVVQIVVMNFGAMLQIPILLGYIAYRSNLEFHSPHLSWACGALMLAYGACLLALSVFFCGRLMLKMEPYIFEKLLRQR